MPFSSSFRSTAPAMPECSRGELLRPPQQLEPVGIEPSALGGLDLAELVAVGVLRQQRQLRLGRPERILLVLEPHARGKQPVLELVLALRGLRRDQAPLARLAQPVQPLALVAGRGLLVLAQRVELAHGEEIGVAADDRRLLRGLLLADPHGPPLLRALEEVALQAGLEFRSAEDRCRAHDTTLTG